MLDLPLTFLQRPATATTPHPWLLVLMHGVGSNEQRPVQPGAPDTRPLSCAEPAGAVSHGAGFACVV